MSRLLTPKFLLRGFEVSVLASLVGLIVMFYAYVMPSWIPGGNVP